MYDNNSRQAETAIALADAIDVNAVNTLDLADEVDVDVTVDVTDAVADEVDIFLVDALADAQIQKIIEEIAGYTDEELIAIDALLWRAREDDVEVYAHADDAADDDVNVALISAELIPF